MNASARLVWLLVGLLSLMQAGCQRGSQNQATLEKSWGTRGLLPGQFVKPRAIAIDPKDGTQYIVDMRAVIQVFDKNDKHLTQWLSPSHEIGRPSGLAVMPDGNLAVADSHYHQILIYNREGDLLEKFGGDDPSQPLGGVFDYIGDIVCDSAGNMYIAESQLRERITKISPEREIMAQWGQHGTGPGEFQRIRSITLNQQGEIVVADACNHRIQIFTPDGKFVRSLGEPGSNAGQLSYPYDVAVARDGTMYVCEYGNHRAQRFSADGKSLGMWGQAGRTEGCVWNPWGLDIAPDGKVILLDSNNHRVHRLQF